MERPNRPIGGVDGCSVDADRPRGVFVGAILADWDFSQNNENLIQTAGIVNPAAGVVSTTATNARRSAKPMFSRRNRVRVA